MERMSKVRAWVLLGLFGLVLVWFSWTLFRLQIIETDGNTDNTTTYSSITRVKAARGDILDRNGVKMVGNRASYDLVFNHYVIISSDNTNESLLKLVKKCRELGIEERTVECDYDFTQGIAMTEELLKRYPDVDGIIACNDIVAISTYKVLHKRNIPVPETIQLIGFDDISFATLLSPELTTICQPVKEMAEKAVELIVNNELASMTDGKFLFPVTLVTRQTTKKKGEQQ